MKLLKNMLSLMSVLWFISCSPQVMNITKNDNLLNNLLQSRTEYFQHIMSNLDQYDVQIIYTQIDRDADNKPHFTTFTYNLDSTRYFYPASTVKLPAALMALEKLNKLNVQGLNKFTSMLTDSISLGQSTALRDTTSETGLPNIAHYVKKIFLTSDNDAFNRLYEFIGQHELNQRLRARGYSDSRIIHRLAIPLSEEENRNTNPIRFLKEDSVIYSQPGKYNSLALPLKGEVLLGNAHVSEGQLVEGPMDFSRKNFFPLDEMHQMLKALMFPESVDPAYTFDLSNEDYRFLYQYMSQLPGETTYPHYPKEKFHDSYVKPFMFGNEKKELPSHIRIFNKFGQSYGYLIDNAYIIDLQNQVEFMLSAVIHTNRNKTFNDDQYEYDVTGFPFMKHLGEVIYQYELQRPRAHQPNLTKFMITYDEKVKVSDNTHVNLYQNYEHFHVPRLNHRRIKREDIAPLINDLKSNSLFTVSKLGESVEGRDINLIQLGNGPKKVLLWSQMHGDESTATRALFEMFEFFKADDFFNDFRNKILNECTLYIIPMLNPDGAEVFERRNALSIDLNRDALRLTSPEARILKTVRDKYDPDFGFNLHDQSKYYNTYRTSKTASISFLAPAYNYEKEVNDKRADAMKVIVAMNQVLQQYIPGRVGRYDDAFEPRAFGDNIQKWGTRTILIESGGYPDDPEKKELVKMNFVAILHALEQIAGDDYKDLTREEYENIPENDRKYFDLLIRNGSLMRKGKPYLMDVGIFVHEKTDEGQLSFTSTVDDLGDLSTYYGYEELDAQGMTIEGGAVYPDTIETPQQITTEQALQWLREGYTTVRVKDYSEEKRGDSPIRIIDENHEEPEEPDIGDAAYFIIRRGNEVVYAVVNGRLVQL